MTSPPEVHQIRQHFNTGNTNSENDTVNLEATLPFDFFDKTLNIWGVSFLSGFQHSDEVALKHYAKKIREKIASLLTYENVTYDVKITILEDVKPRPSPSDLSPVKIIVESKGSKGVQLIYTGIMMSWRTDIPESEHKNFVKLPLILCKGMLRTIKSVHGILEEMFNCHIIELAASQDDLKWLVPIILNTYDAEDAAKNQKFLFEYKIPDLPDSDSITTKYKYHDLAKIWNTICSCDDDSGKRTSFRIEDIERFWKIFNDHMMRSSGLRLNLCLLNKISLPFCTIMGNKMKISSGMLLDQLLLYFNEKSLQVHNSSNF